MINYYRMIIALLIILFCSCSFSEAANDRPECVILLHGLARTEKSLLKLEHHLDKLKDTPIFKWIYGPAGQQLGTDKESLPRKLGAPGYEVGIITGDKSINPILSLLIPVEDDGRVSVENAKLKGMKDFLIVDKTHSFIMNDQTVLRQVTFFYSTWGI